MVDFSLTEIEKKIAEELGRVSSGNEETERYYDIHEDEIQPQTPPDPKKFENVFKLMGERAKEKGASSMMMFMMNQMMNQRLGGMGMAGMAAAGGGMAAMGGGSGRGGGLGNSSLTAAGTAEQKKKWGDYNLAMANTEPGCGSDSKAIETTAELDGDEWVLNGEKIFVTGGIRCDGVVVWATLDRSKGRGAIKSFLVMKGTPGFELSKKEKKLGIRSSDTAAFVLKDCRIPRENLLGLDEEIKTGGGGFKGLMQTFNMTRPGVAAGGISNVNGAYEFVKEAMKKEGIEIDWEAGPYNRLDAVGKMIDLEAQLEAGRLTVLRAMYLAEKGKPNNLEAAVAKAKGGEISRTGAQMTVELLGAIGITHDQLVEKAFRDARITDIYEGTGEINRLVVARAILNYSSADLM